MPVLEEHRSVGSIRESHVLAKLLENRELLDGKVGDVMDESFPVLEADASLVALPVPAGPLHAATKASGRRGARS